MTLSVVTTMLYTPAICTTTLNSEDLRTIEKAQSEAARRRGRPKSDCGTVRGLKFRLQQSHVAPTLLHYLISGAMLINLGGTKRNS